MGEKDILVLSKDKQVLNFSDDPEKMSFLGSQKYKLTPESKIKYNKLEKEAAKKSSGFFLKENLTHLRKKLPLLLQKLLKKLVKKPLLKKFQRVKSLRRLLAEPTLLF